MNIFQKKLKIKGNKNIKTNIPSKIKKIIRNKNIKANIYRL